MYKLISAANVLQQCTIPNGYRNISITNSTATVQRKLSTYLDCFMTQNADQLYPYKPKRKQPLHIVEGIMLHIKRPFKLHGLTVGPAQCVYITRKNAKSFYSQMQSVRLIENIGYSLRKASHMQHYRPASSNQEACAVGVCAAMRNNDRLISGGQCLSWANLLGVTPYQILTEMCVKRDNVSTRDQGGIMRMCGSNFYCGNGVPGAQVPLGGGLAFASKCSGDNSTCLTLYEPKSINTSLVFDTFNMAALWKLPCIFVCQTNNVDKKTHVPSKRMTFTDVDHYMRGHYIPGIWLNGRDVLSVLSATKFAINYVREHGPIILEMNTAPTAQCYDPIQNFKNICTDCHLFSEEDANRIDRRIDRQVNRAMHQRGQKVSLDVPIMDACAKRLELKKTPSFNFLDTINKKMTLKTAR